MAKRKLTIDEALTFLKTQGVSVRVDSLTHELPRKAESILLEVPKEAQSISPRDRLNVKSLPKLVRIALYAQHSVGSGGSLSVNQDQIENAGVQTYGPGICMVPRELVSHLVYKDQVARQADERMLEKTQRSYIILQRHNPSGQQASIGLRLPDGVDFDGVLATYDGFNIR